MLSPCPTHSQLVLASSHALEQIWDGDDLCVSRDEQKTHIAAVADILQTNLSNGRWHHATAAHKAAQPNVPELQQYATRVATYYWIEHERVAGLAAKDWTLWEELDHQLLKKAYLILYIHIGLPQPVAFERANDYAQKACELIFRGRYPFDVPFLAWATRVLTNCIYTGEGRSTDLLDRGTFVEPALTGVPDLEWIEEIYWLEDEQDIRHWEDRELLWDAIQHLASQTQQQVIIRDFLYGQSTAEIAQALDKTTQSVYNLRHRALVTLREILGA